jgi:glucokinase
VRAAAQAASLHAYARRCRIVGSGLDGDGPLLGAAALALQS